MQQLALDLGLPPESVIAPPLPLAAALKRELVTHMVAAIIAVHQAGGPLTDAHPAPSSQNHPPACCLSNNFSFFRLISFPLACCRQPVQWVSIM